MDELLLFNDTTGYTMLFITSDIGKGTGGDA